ncbi:hypothetical protein ACTHPH_10745 [Paenibacillus pasadenensis]|uniref:Uncharacterized protein n=1 Tax=Paenibacillus pasadenensis TaxID=217090 RepID=A0A2N5NAK0_9BACL|nr:MULTISPECIES: hypothetical protein [Paenibacillus]PLT47381.1 hypothetical protein B8V81_1605 [Paenibacillus pasadenensis]QGG57660.1 hypothetical protein GE073_20040 [Paenibacillus sp. B01]
MSSPESKDNGPIRDGQAGAPHRDVDEAENGSMVQDVDDMKRLGNDMERVRTNAELEQDGLVPDPVQE